MKFLVVSFSLLSILFLSVFGINCVYGYLFPMKYADQILISASKTGIDSRIIFSMVNVESGFDKFAKSNRGAIGLMQVMPTTAMEVSKELGMSSYDLYNESDNLIIGTFYISKLIKQFGNVENALAAYNAGAKNVKNWLKDSKYSKDGKTLFDVPYKETKNYLKKIKTNYKYYKTKIKD